MLRCTKEIYYNIEIWICIFLTCILLLGNFIKCSVETMFFFSLHLLYNGFINSVIVESHFRFLFDIKKRKEKTIERSGNNNTLQNRNENAYKKSPPPSILRMLSHNYKSLGFCTSAR